MTVWIGLTGGIGSGKSQAAAEFLSLGVPVLDADAVSRHLTADHGEALPAIRRVFGDAVFDVSGSLNRAALRERVFASEATKKDLEALLHPLIAMKIRQRQQEELGALYGIVDIPLLVERVAFRRLVDRVLVIDCTEAEQVRRVSLRSGLDEMEVRRIMATQADRCSRLRQADDVLGNHADIATLAEKVHRLHAYYTAACRASMRETR